MNVAYDTGTAGGTWHVDLANASGRQVEVPGRAVRQPAPTTSWPRRRTTCTARLTVEKIWITNGKTLQPNWYDLPRKGQAAGADTSTRRIACGARSLQGNRQAMFDPQTKKITEWTSRPSGCAMYDAQVDDRAISGTLAGRRSRGADECRNRGIHPSICSRIARTSGDQRAEVRASPDVAGRSGQPPITRVEPITRPDG